MEAVIDEGKLKKVLEEALEEVLTERQDLFYDAILEAFEDFGMISAIKEGEKSKTVSREEIFEVVP